MTLLTAAEWLVPTIVIPALVALLVAFGMRALNERQKRKTQAHDEAATVSVAKIGAETALVTVMLERITGLERLGDERDERSQRHKDRIGKLEDDVEKFKDEAAECKRELAALAKRINGLRSGE